MISDRLLTALLYTVVLLVTLLAVLAGCLVVVGRLGDAPSAVAMAWIVGGCSAILATALVLLVVALALRAVDANRRDS